MKEFLLCVIMMGAIGDMRAMDIDIIDEKEDDLLVQLAHQGNTSSAPDSDGDNVKEDEMLSSQTYVNGQSKIYIIKCIAAMARKTDWSKDECQGEGKLLAQKKNNSATRERSFSIGNQGIPKVEEE